MEFYLNEANAEVVKRYLDIYPLDGITLNQKMAGSLGKREYAGILKELRDVLGTKKMFTQVTSEDYENIIREAEFIVSCAGIDTYVKIPSNETGIRAIRTLHERGYRTLGTLCFSTIQAVMALQAGADYVAVLYNYMVQAGYDAARIMRDIAAYVSRSGCKGKLMGVGVRDQMQFSDCVGCGCQAINLNADNLTEWIMNEPSVATLKDFMSGWTASWGELRIKDFIS